MVIPSQSASETTSPTPAGTSGKEQDTPEHQPSLIVAIGASAGGHEALEQILGNLPATSGLAFVVITHIPADTPSHLAGFIQRFTPMPVLTAEENQAFEP